MEESHLSVVTFFYSTLIMFTWLHYIPSPIVLSYVLRKGYTICVFIHKLFFNIEWAGQSRGRENIFVTSSIQPHLFFHLRVFIINLLKHAGMHWKGRLNNVRRFMLAGLDFNSTITFHFKPVIKPLLLFESCLTKHFLVSNVAGRWMIGLAECCR